MLRKEPRYPLNRGLGGPQSVSERIGEETHIPPPPPGIEPRFLRPLAYRLVTIPSDPWRLVYKLHLKRISFILFFLYLSFRAS